MDGNLRNMASIYLYDENSTDSKPLKRLYNKVKEEKENEKNEK